MKKTINFVYLFFFGGGGKVIFENYFLLSLSKISLMFVCGELSIIMMLVYFKSLLVYSYNYITSNFFTAA